MKRLRRLVSYLTTLFGQVRHVHNDKFLTEFLGYCVKFQKSTIRFVMCVHLSVRPSILLHGTTLLPLDGFLCNLKFEYFFFENLLRNFMFNSNLTRITGTLHEHQYTFLISRSILLRMRNFSDKSCTANQKTHFMFNNFSKTAPFMRQCEQMLYSPTGHR